MPTFTQSGRPIAVSTPLGADAVLLNGFTGTEAISAPFRFHLDLLAPASSPVAFASLLGESATISLMQVDGSLRPFNGVVVRLSEGPRLPGAGGSGTFLRYTAELAPRFWLLKLRVQSRIFQQLAVPDILTKVLAGVTIDNQIQGTFDPRDYCVQYRESDFDFACRLMEEEGIFYYFTHSDSGHTMVLDNTPQAYAKLAISGTINYETMLGGTRPDERIYAWEKSQEIRPGK
jgi:type VI secretion system secreted protein VgrG